MIRFVVRTYPFHDKCPGFFYVHYTTHRTYSFTTHPKDEAIEVKCLSQEHKRRNRPGWDTNPHSGNTRTWVQCTKPLGHDTPQTDKLILNDSQFNYGIKICGHVKYASAFTLNQVIILTLCGIVWLLGVTRHFVGTYIESINTHINKPCHGNTFQTLVAVCAPAYQLHECIWSAREDRAPGRDLY